MDNRERYFLEKATCQKVERVQQLITTYQNHENDYNHYCEDELRNLIGCFDEIDSFADFKEQLDDTNNTAYIVIDDNDKIALYGFLYIV